MGDKNILPIHELPGWQEADLSTLRQTLLKRTSENNYQSGPFDYLQGIPKSAYESNAAFKEYLENNFQAEFKKEQETQGLATGYFQPILKVSLYKSPSYPYPIYRKPENLIIIEDLGPFNPAAKGIRIAGTLENGTLKPYYTRREIEHEANEIDATVIAYTNDRIGLYFAHIQGSARLEFENKEIRTISYGGANGHPYTSIGKYMIEKGLMNPDQASMQTITSVLEGLSLKKQDDILHQNKSYIFFKETNTQTPTGWLGSELVPVVSIAVDPYHVRLGSLVWFNASSSGPDKETIQTLTIAEDVGSAIKGSNRADLFWGTGPKAASFAGSMKSNLKLYTLVPKSARALT